MAGEGFTLVSPGYRRKETGCGLAFSVGPHLVAELGADDLAESWAAAAALTAAEAAELTEAAAGHLLDVMEQGTGAADLAEAVTDAAVVFLIAMRRHGITAPERIPACTVFWNAEARRERVRLAS